MISIIRESIANVPCLHVVKEDDKHHMRPLVIFIHGFTSAKEHNLHFGYLLAEAGYRVVLPDALYHGERPNPLSDNELHLSFWDIVLTTIRELEEIKNELVDRKLVDPHRIGVVGTSMGGIVTFGALTQYDWIRVAGSLMGSPCYQTFFDLQLQFAERKGMTLPLSNEQIETLRNTLMTYDLSLQPEKLNGRPLFIWHGKQDDVVPFDYTYAFYKQIEPFHEPLMMLIDEHAGHKVTREAFLQTVQWFVTHL
ncbi:alpha/beta fold hydrolase [Anoxybacillus sp. ST70]|uniref:alpha/beta fold hydrolase n=1 Tax=Anoxybacillus TaxID=150247 RepID=UPI0002FFF5D4|nr:alpha/beta fold hydrolase [Anoxybacillus sp. ST70]MBW9217446.1 alpha/beta fold hydrolase [Anoxybacillus sp. ST70]